MILRLIRRNILRNKRRSLITMSSVAFAVLLAIVFRSLQIGVFENLIHNVAGMHTGYLQLHLKGYQSEPVIDNTFVAAPVRKQLTGHGYKHSDFLARLESFSLVSANDITKGCMVIGTEPEQEEKLTGIRKRIVNGRYFSAAEKDCLLAEGLARLLRCKVGDTVVVLGQGYQGNLAAGKYRICG